ncbi:sensor domain-containing diguanylate cyclase [Acinetobacter baylyi]|nr:sensor domain-containing diguanylate cyclase [Acinetobacter baylyi]KAF2371907.1 histidine kinase [Acinetobacter baylyi]KAF2375239.1 histidine kinase [Acinetobacter baylyi]KAF2376002.1 histidine kinase [Acinetobacter baylyi]KAF2382666.1 histidine kinase [Acinetobacter baylyi]KAF2384928.1 histidine kinase [Acinetobacter baylyi]
MQNLDASIFDLAPIPMWLEDYSQIKIQFDLWRSQGVVDLKAFLSEDLERVRSCAHKIKVIKINQKTLDLFEASSQQELCSQLHQIFQQDMLHSHLYELVDLWDGKTQFSSQAVNYTLSGKRLDIQLHGQILPGYENCLSRVLLTTEDVTNYQNALRLEEKNRRLAESRFNYSPTSLWVEDFTRVKMRLDQLRDIGIDDFRTFLDVHPEFVNQCVEDILILDVNQATLDLFQAPDKATLLKNTHKIFAKEMASTFREQLIELWKGNIHHQREAINYALDGSIRNVLLQFTVFPGYEHNWSVVQVALTDITARKKAENYLEYLGKHDVLTKLHNRSFYTEEINRLERSIVRPVSCIFLDMNGLKDVNDHLGHDAGDDLLRRVGHILTQAIQQTSYTASRIGGDEFVILMPGTEETAVMQILQTIYELLNIDNQFYSSQPISIAIGYATTQHNESIEDMLKRADQDMYKKKRDYHIQ